MILVRRVVFQAMSDQQHDSGLDWLYRREPEPERTRIYPQQEAAASRPESSSYPQASSSLYPHSSAQQPPAQTARTPVAALPGVRRPPPAGRSPRTRRPKRRHPIRRLVLALVLAWMLFMVGTPIYAWTIGTVIPATPEGSRPADQPGTAMLLVGSDGREN